MTVWCVCGSRPPRDGYSESEVRRGRNLMDVFFRPGDKLITGGCKGWDAIAMQHAHERGLHLVTLLPVKDRFTDYEAVRLYSDEVEDTGVGYWARDQLEVDRSDKVLAFPLYERERSTPTSGTWHTWDLAGRAEKQAVLMVVRPRLTGPRLFGPDRDRVARVFAQC